MRTRDVTQAYTQSQSELEYPVPLKPLSEMHLPAHLDLRIWEPLHGVPESDLLCYRTYLSHHEKNLGMKCPIVESCLVYWKVLGTNPDVIAIQVDESLSTESSKRIEKEDKNRNDFLQSQGTFWMSELHAISLVLECPMKMLEVLLYPNLPKFNEGVCVWVQLQYIVRATTPDLASSILLLTSNLQSNCPIAF